MSERIDKSSMERALQEANQRLDAEMQARRQAEDALRQSEHQFQTLIQNQSEGIGLMDPDEYFSFVNPAAERIFGVPAGALVGRSLCEFLDENQYRHMLAQTANRRQGKSNTYDVKIVRPDGKIRQLLVTAAPRFDQEHTFIGTFGIFRDITERELAEQALQASEARFRKISELISDYAYVFDIDETGNWRCEWVTEAFTRITGYTAEDFDGPGDWMTLVHPDDWSTAAQHRQRILAGNTEVTEYRLVTRDHDVFWLRDYSHPVWDDRLGRVVQVFGAAQDISERKLAEQQTQQLWRRLEFLLTVSPAVIYTSQPRQTLDFTFISENVQKLIGYAPYEIIEHADFWSAHVHPDDRERIFTGIAHIFERDHSIHEYRVRHKDGTYRWLRDEMILVRGAQDQPMEIIGSWSNITQRKLAETERHHLEDQLRQSQRLEALGTLAGGIAHDFNNILGTILGYTTLLLEDCDGQSQEHVFLERVDHAGKRAKDLVQQILAFSRTHEFQRLKPTEMSPIVEEALDLLRATTPTNITIQHHLQQECPKILANASQIHQIVVNLCVNAVQSMKPQGGLLTVVLEDVHYSVDHHQILGLHRGTYVELTVTDTGCGMPPEVRERIFEPFFTTKRMKGGTGLGLSVVHGIVKGHHGVITVDSEINKGTRVRIFFPTTDTLTTSLELSETHQHLQGHESILVVDDEPALAKLYEIALTKRGYHVTALTRSPDALEYFQVNPYQFDLVVLDQDMPDLTGTELSQRLLQLRPELPIILVTGYDEEISEENLKSIGIRQWFMKPMDAVDLIRVIRTILTPTRE